MHVPILTMDTGMGPGTMQCPADIVARQTIETTKSKSWDGILLGVY